MRMVGWIGALGILGLAGGALAADPDGFQLELGVRVEQLRYDEGLEFACACDPEEDPGCDTDPDYCKDVRLEEPLEGYLIGGLVGAQGRGRWFGLGVRVVGSAGSFSPTEPDPRIEDQDVLLAQVAIELRLEAHADLGPAELFVQASPRFGGLYYLDSNQDSPVTAVAGVILSAGLRFGSPETRIGAEVGRVVHSSFGGWMAQATYNGMMDAPHDEQPPVPIEDIPVPGGTMPADDPAEPAPPVEEAAPVEAPPTLR